MGRQEANQQTEESSWSLASRWGLGVGEGESARGWGLSGAWRRGLAFTCQAWRH